MRRRQQLMKEVSVVLVGIGGYGNKYVEYILREGREKVFEYLVW